MRLPIPARWLLASLCLLAAAPVGAQSAEVTALREGNRLFREGRLDDAYAAYVDGHDMSRPHPVLSYNIGTTTHHLGRLPEAILWYRRAATVNPGDPWLQENLEIAREALGLQPYPEPGLLGAITLYRRLLLYIAAAVLWIGAAVWIMRSRSRLLVPVAIMAVGLALYGGVVLASRWAPAAAVVTVDCSAPTGDLPAGSEVWIVRETGQTLEIATGTSTLACPIDTVARVVDEH